MAEQRSFRVDMEKLVRVMVANRLWDPRFKLGLLEWVERVALPGVEKAQVTHSNLLRATDVIMAHKEELETGCCAFAYVRPAHHFRLSGYWAELKGIQRHRVRLA